MANVPEHLLRRSAEAKAKSLGVPFEQVWAEMTGGAAPTAAAAQELADRSPLTPKSIPATPLLKAL